jgi:hypothetical protein
VGHESRRPAFRGGRRRTLLPQRQLPDARHPHDRIRISGLHRALQRPHGNSRRLEGRPNGIAFYGTNGTLIVDRGSWEVVPENAPRFPNDYDRVAAWLQTGNVAQPAGFDRGIRTPARPRCEALSESGLKIDPACQEAHIENFLDCVRTRRRPVADVETGYRSVSACHVGVIAYRLGRKVRWDAQSESFPGDHEAQALMTKKYRTPWSV